jgi:hypothetical protein
MPYKKNVHIYEGYVVDIFDDENPDWQDNMYWSPTDEERGIVVSKKPNDVYGIIVGVPQLREIDVNSVVYKTKPKDTKKIKNEPLRVKLIGSDEEAYLLENLVPGKTSYLTMIGTPVDYPHKLLRIYKTSVYETKPYNYTSSVSTKDDRPYPYSFYGKCNNSNQYVDRVGVRSRNDNRFYPFCKTVTNKAQAMKEIEFFIMNGLTAEQKKDGDIPEVELYTEGHEQGKTQPFDKYVGTFKPGTTDIGNRITYKSDKGTWKEGIIIDKSRTRLGNDHNVIKYEIKNDNGHVETIDGSSIHPKYKEFRNFPGLIKIFPVEADRKNFLIECAKKLNLVRNDISLGLSSPEQTQEILSAIKKIKNVPITKNTLHKTSIIELSKEAHRAVLVPTNSESALLHINKQGHCHIIIDNKVYEAGIVGESNDLLIDGFLTENNEFYPFDVVSDGVVSEGVVSGEVSPPDYIQRLNNLDGIVGMINEDFGYEKTIVIKKPLGSSREFRRTPSYIGPVEERVSLIEYVKHGLSKETNILFVPNKGRTALMWKYVHVNLPIVFIAKRRDEQGWVMGMKIPTADEWVIFGPRIPQMYDKNNRLIKINDAVSIKYNLTRDGTIDLKVPALELEIVNVNPEFYKTVEQYNSMTRRINPSDLKKEMWVSKDKVLKAGNSSMDPLVIVGLE